MRRRAPAPSFFSLRVFPARPTTPRIPRGAELVTSGVTALVSQRPYL